MAVPLIAPPVRDWWCPQCGARDQTREAGPHTRYHTCPRLRMMSVPMVPAGTKARISLHEREDYVGTERVQVDPELGRPVMSLVTERPDGSNDVEVFAPLATVGIRST